MIFMTFTFRYVLVYEGWSVDFKLNLQVNYLKFDLLLFLKLRFLVEMETWIQHINNEFVDKLDNELRTHPNINIWRRSSTGIVYIGPIVYNEQHTVSSKSIGRLTHLLLFWLCTPAVWIWNDKVRLSASIWGYFHPYRVKRLEITAHNT